MAKSNWHALSGEFLVNIRKQRLRRRQQRWERAEQSREGGEEEREKGFRCSEKERLLLKISRVARDEKGIWPFNTSIAFKIFISSELNIRPIFSACHAFVIIQLICSFKNDISRVNHCTLLQYIFLMCVAKTLVRVGEYQSVFAFGWLGQCLAGQPWTDITSAFQNILSCHLRTATGQRSPVQVLGLIPVLRSRKTSGTRNMRPF